MPSSPSIPRRPSPGSARTARGAETDQDTVIRFIDRFRSARDVFLHGMCYWFSSRFLIPWSELEALDQNLYQILLRDCVRKEPYER